MRGYTCLIASLVAFTLFLTSCGAPEATGVTAVLPQPTVSMSTLTSAPQPTQVQSDIVPILKTLLAQKQIPVKDIKITNQSPLTVEITIQSTSNNQRVTPDDAIFSTITDQQIALARRHQIKIDILKVTIVNSQGQPISWSEIPVDKSVDTSPVIPSQIDNATLVNAIREQIPLNGMAIQTLDVALNEDQAQMITMTLSVPDIHVANFAVPSFMPALAGLMQRLKSERGAQIASYRVDVVDNQGQPLLKYMRYYLGSEEHEGWWQADGMTQDWFPHPVPPGAPSDTNTPLPTPPYPAPSQ